MYETQAVWIFPQVCAPKLIPTLSACPAHPACLKSHLLGPQNLQG